MHYTSKLQICKHDDSNKSSTLTAPINKIQIDIARERTTLIIKMKAKVHFHFQNTNGLEFHFHPHYRHSGSNIFIKVPTKFKYGTNFLDEEKQLTLFQMLSYLMPKFDTNVFCCTD